MNPLIKAGDTILVDFDGVIVKAKREDGTDYYPEIGPIIPGIREFLCACRDRGIVVEIWSARTNRGSGPEHPIHSHSGYLQIQEFLDKNNLPYSKILTVYKPIGTHHARYLLDDRTFNCENGFDYHINLFNRNI
jgi:hypothetical protein